MTEDTHTAELVPDLDALGRLADTGTTGSMLVRCSDVRVLIAAARRLAAVEALAERADRKGYDLDAYEVLEACNTPEQRGAPS